MEILRWSSSFIPSCTVLYRVYRHRNSPIRRESLCRFCVWTVSLFGVDGRSTEFVKTRRLWKKVWCIELSAWEKIWTTKLSKYLRRFRLMRHRLADATEGNVWVPKARVLPEWHQISACNELGIQHYLRDLLFYISLQASSLHTILFFTAFCFKPIPLLSCGDLYHIIDRRVSWKGQYDLSIF